MPGETSINKLLQTLKVALHPSTFYFVTVDGAGMSSIPVQHCHMLFREREGTTLIIDSEVAEQHFSHLSTDQLTFPSRMITCDVHSSLEAVGFMPVISGKLAEAGISCNPVSAFYHDHLFVPKDRAADAIRVLEQLATSTQNDDEVDERS